MPMRVIASTAAIFALLGCGSDEKETASAPAGLSPPEAAPDFD
jgi:hypothetical protein